MPYNGYAYRKDPQGAYTSIFGDRVKKVQRFSKKDPDTFEADVPSTTRTLVDLYTESDEVSDGHTTLIWDIEVEMETGKPNSMEAEQAITAVGFWDSQTEEYAVYILDEEGTIEERTVDKDGKTVHIKPFDNEKNLVLGFLEKWEEIRPTLITHWNGDYFDVPYLYNRLKRLFGEKTANRLSPIGAVTYNEYRRKYFIAGVSSLDYMKLYKKFTYHELDNYRLDTIGRTEVDKGKIEYNGSLDDLFRDDIEKFIEYNLVDVEILVLLDKKLRYLDLVRGICHVGHVPYEDYEFSSRYLEGAILTYLKKRNLVAPNKSDIRLKFEAKNFHRKGRETIQVSEQIPDVMITNGQLTIQKSKSSNFSVKFDRFEGDTFYLSDPLPEDIKEGFEIRPKLPGAFVKFPQQGKHKWAYDLDLTSLYPSIIMSLNISPETKVGKVEDIAWDSKKFATGKYNDTKLKVSFVDHEEPIIVQGDKFKEFLEEQNCSISPNGILYDLNKVGCIPDILDMWFEKRAEYRKLEKKYGLEENQEQYEFYNKRQLVQKIMLNTMYGALGLPSFRFYDVDNATAVTSTGRSVIKNTADVGNLKYNKELGEPMTIVLENGEEHQLTANRPVTIRGENGNDVIIKAGELNENHDIIEINGIKV